MSLPHPSRLLELQLEVVAATAPATELELWFAHQVARAAWEMERIHHNSPNPDADHRLTAEYSHASRAWNRARNELAAIQSNRVRHTTALSAGRQTQATQAPLGRPSQPTKAGVMAEHLLDLLQEGYVESPAIRILSEQRAR